MGPPPVFLSVGATVVVLGTFSGVGDPSGGPGSTHGLGESPGCCTSARWYAGWGGVDLWWAPSLRFEAGIWSFGGTLLDTFVQSFVPDLIATVEVVQGFAYT